MSQSLQNLINSIEVIAKMRLNVTGSDFAWSKLYNAEKYLQKQVALHFAE